MFTKFISYWPEAIALMIPAATFLFLTITTASA
jgi:hypothetical protein